MFSLTQLKQTSQNLKLITAKCFLCSNKKSATSSWCCTSCHGKVPMWTIEFIESEEIRNHIFAPEIITAILQYIVNSNIPVDYPVREGNGLDVIVNDYIVKMQNCMVDVPSRSFEWAEQFACYNHNENCHCALSTTADHRIAFALGLTPHFKANCCDFIEQLWILNNCANSELNIVSKAEALNIISSHPYFNFVRTMDDKYFDPEQLEDFYFPCLYQLRELVGDYNDYGYKAISTFNAQGLTASSFFLRKQRELQLVIESAQPIMNNITEVMSNISKTVTEWALTFVSKLGAIGKSIVKVITQLFMSFMTGVWIPKELVDAVIDGSAAKRIFKFAMFGAVVLAGFVGLIPTHLMTTFVQNPATIFALVGTAGFAAGYLAQAANPIELIVDACCHFFDLEEDTISILKRRCRIVMLYTGAAGAVVSLSKSLLFLLPEASRIVLLAKFGNKVDKMKYDVNSWKSSALSLITCSKLQNVAFEKEYEEMVTTTIKNGMAINAQLNTPGLSDLRTGFLQVLSKLIQIKGDLEQLKNAQKSRSRPFCFHIAGKAGIGKSTIVKKLISDITGMDPDSEMYCVPKEDKFWNGYGRHPIILMDEFLVGVEETNQELAQLFLSLVSNQTFYPPMASVDNMAMGMKGATATPKVVVTMNNTTHDRPACFSANEDHMNAFQRRREVVVEIVRSNNYHHLPNEDNKIDYTKYTDEQMEVMDWARFRILPGQHSFACTRIGTLTYHQLVDSMQNLWENHLESAWRFNQVFENVNEVETYDVATVIRQLQKDCFDIPQPKSLTESLIHMLPVFAQGPAVETIDQAISVFERASLDETIVEANLLPIEDVNNAYSKLFTETKLWLGRMSLETARVDSKKILKYGAIFGATLALAYAVKQVLTGEAEDEVVEIETQNYGGHKAKFTRKVKSRNWKKAAKTAQGPMATAVADLYVNSGTVRCIPIKSRYVLTYYHGLLKDGEIIEDGTPLSIILRGQRYDFDFDSENCRYDEEADIIVFEVTNKSYPLARDITKRFVSEFAIPESNVNCVLKTQEMPFFPIAQLTANVEYLKKGIKSTKVFKLDQCYKYAAPTTIGDCGTPLIVLHGENQGDILGIHVAGSGPKSIQPVGIATIVTRESLYELFSDLCVQGPEEIEVNGLPLLTEEIDQSLSSLFNLSDYVNENMGEFPNVISIEKVNPKEFVCIGRQSKVKKTAISPFLKTKTDRTPAILSAKDPRSGGLDPAAVNLNAMFKKPDSIMEPKLCKLVAEAVVDNLNKNLNYHGYKRELTFEEALAGIPGKLASLNMKTSPGWPLKLIATQSGKKSFCWFDEAGNLQYTEGFKTLCLERYEMIKNYDGVLMPKRSLGYLKDECRTAKKIKAVATRTIFCDDLVTIVAMRMIFGHLLLAFNNSFPNVPYAIGVNQYSKDFDIIANVLTPINDEFVAGDFSNFDGLYDQTLFTTLLDTWTQLSDIPNANSWRFMKDHMLTVIFLFECVLVQLKCINPSGTLFTTIFNCMMNEGYQRYNFKILFPLECFDKCVKGVYLGDDHTLAFLKVLGVTPKLWGDSMNTIGQRYTSALKGELEDYCSPMEQCPFLGANPVRIDGQWSGAMRLETLDKMLHYSRGDLNQTVTCVLDLASQHPKEVFIRYKTDIEQAYEKAGLMMPIIGSYLDVRDIQANRTATSGADFNRFWCQGPMENNQGTVQEAGMVQLQVVDTLVKPSNTISNAHRLKNKAINEQDATLDFGLNSFIKRATLSWTSAQATDTLLASYQLPFGLLNFPSTTLQGMNFNNFIYSIVDMEVQLVITGVPTQAGSVIIAWVPLSAGAPNLINLTTLDHVFLDPSKSNSVTINLPFKYFRTMLNNSQTIDAMGSLLVKVYSPLSSQAASSCEITVFTRYNGDFSLPRALFVAQGGNVSTMNTYSLSNIGGNVPLQTTTDSKATSSVTPSTTFSMPLDNPPVVGSGIITAHMYPSMCKTIGLEPTVPLGLHNEVFSRQPISISDPEESALANLFNKPSLIETLVLSTTDVVGQVKSLRPMNSLFGIHNTGTSWDFSNAVQCPINLAVLNQFARWRADFIVELFSIKTAFHSFRLLITIAYGVSTVADGDEHKYLNHVLDFNNEVDRNTVQIPFNAPQEFLRAYNGGGGSQLTEYSQGVFKVTVLNPLKVSGQVVSSSVELKMFLRCDNVRVALIKPGTLVQAEEQTSPSLEVVVPPEVLEGQGPEVNATQVTTATKTSLPDDKPCRLVIGEKYEMLPANLHEIVRRYRQINIHDAHCTSTTLNDDLIFGAGPISQVIGIPVFPHNFYKYLYRGWSGTLKYRIIISNGLPGKVWYDADGSRQGQSDNTNGGGPNAMDDGFNAGPGYSQISSWDPLVRIRNSYFNTELKPLEITYGSGAGGNTWIDVSVPFNSEKNFLPNWTGNQIANSSITNYSNGTLYITVENEFFPIQQGSTMSVYQACGDDFRYHVFCPRDNIRLYAYRAAEVSSVPEDANGGVGTNFNGNWLTRNVV